MQQYNQDYFELQEKPQKEKKEHIIAVDGHVLAIMTDQFQYYLCHAQIKAKDIEFCIVILASVDGQKFKDHKVILSASRIFFKKLLVNNLNHHPFIFCLLVTI